MNVTIEHSANLPPKDVPNPWLMYCGLLPKRKQRRIIATEDIQPCGRCGKNPRIIGRNGLARSMCRECDRARRRVDYLQSLVKLDVPQQPKVCITCNTAPTVINRYGRALSHCSECRNRLAREKRK